METDFQGWNNDLQDCRIFKGKTVETEKQQGIDDMEVKIASPYGCGRQTEELMEHTLAVLRLIIHEFAHATNNSYK